MSSTPISSAQDPSMWDTQDVGPSQPLVPPKKKQVSKFTKQTPEKAFASKKKQQQEEEEERDEDEPMKDAHTQEQQQEEEEEQEDPIPPPTRPKKRLPRTQTPMEEEEEESNSNSKGQKKDAQEEEEEGPHKGEKEEEQQPRKKRSKKTVVVTKELRQESSKIKSEISALNRVVTTSSQIARMKKARKEVISKQNPRRRTHAVDMPRTVPNGGFSHKSTSAIAFSTWRRLSKVKKGCSVFTNHYGYAHLRKLMSCCFQSLKDKGKTTLSKSIVMDSIALLEESAWAPTIGDMEVVFKYCRNNEYRDRIKAAESNKKRSK